MLTRFDYKRAFATVSHSNTQAARFRSEQKEGSGRCGAIRGDGEGAKRERDEHREDG